MKKLNALCLISFVVLLSACSTPKTAVVVSNPVPNGLLQCAPEPEKPSFNTGNNLQDFKNIASYAANVKDAGQDCRAKLSEVSLLLKNTSSQE